MQGSSQQLPRARAEMWDSLGKDKGLGKQEQAEISSGLHLHTPLHTALGALQKLQEPERVLKGKVHA